MLKSLARYNVAWDAPSVDSAGSMSLGNGQVGVNLWVEPSGDVVFYLCHTDAWDDNHHLVKLGRLRLRLVPALSCATAFRQECDR